MLDAIKIALVVVAAILAGRWLAYHAGVWFGRGLIHAFRESRWKVTYQFRTFENGELKSVCDGETNVDSTVS